MQATEIFKLRKCGDTLAAYKAAKEALEALPDNLWLKKAMAWVLYDLLSQNVSFDKRNSFITYLKEFADLKLEHNEAENMLFQSIIFKINSFLHNFSRQEKKDYSTLDQLLEILKSINYSRPSLLHSIIAERMVNFASEWNQFMNFIKWWQIDNLRDEDYKKRKIETLNREILSLAEHLYIKTASVLLSKWNSYLHLPDSDLSKVRFKDCLNRFALKLQSLIKNHPDYNYAQYYYSKVLIALGEKNKAIEAFIPFAQKNLQKFWIWDNLADMFSEQAELYLTCLCKAISLPNPDKMLVNVRAKLINFLISQNKLVEAKFEINKLINTYKKEGWNIKPQISRWTNADWFVTTQQINSNNLFYRANTKNLATIVFPKQKTSVGLIYQINSLKNIAYYLVDEHLFGSFSYKAMGVNLREGDFIELILSKKQTTQGTQYKVVAAFYTDKRNEQLVKPVEGFTKVSKNSDACFVNDAIISGFLLKQFGGNKLIQKKLTGQAIKSYVPAKSEWGWKVITIDKISNV